MKLLLANANRDLLLSYEKLLRMDGHDVTSAFDGTQVVSLLAHGPYDVAILDEDLPRVAHERLVALMQREGLPVIVLLNGRITVRHLLRAELASDYLSLPFLPDDLGALIDSVHKKASSGQLFTFGDAAVDTAYFRFEGTGVRLTGREIDLMSALLREERIQGKHARTIILALNEKLAKLNRSARIEYELEKGYRLVNKHE